MKDDEIRKAVREHYASIATKRSSCCSPQEPASALSCCAPPQTTSNTSCCSPRETDSKAIGYSDEELRVLPEGANLGLGCGNPIALASLAEGETVLDLGSGAGFDCFLSAKKVGEKGKVIGVDMTPEMIEKARENAQRGNFPRYCGLS